MLHFSTLVIDNSCQLIDKEGREASKQARAGWVYLLLSESHYCIDEAITITRPSFPTSLTNFEAISIDLPSSFFPPRLFTNWSRKSRRQSRQQL